MKLLRAAPLIGLLLWAIGAAAQTSITTSSSATSGCATITTDTDKSTVGIQVTGTWTGTLQPQVAIQGQAAVNTQVTPAGSSTPQSTITVNGIYTTSVAGTSTFQLCGPTGTGTAVVWLNGSKAAVKVQGGGSGSGTVSANNTAAGAVANYAAAGGSTTVGPTTLNYVAPTLTVSTAGGGNGVVALSGNTSGAASLTAPAVGGTNTNPIVSSNAISIPATAGTAGLVNGSVANSGISFGASSQLNIIQAGVVPWAFDAGTHFGAGSGQVVAWSSATTGTGSFDAGLSRTAVGVLAVGNGTAANKAGFLQSGNSVFVTADFTTSGVGTALENITGLTWTFPATALNFSFHCHLGFHQNVATAAVAFGLQDTTNAPANIMATGHEQSNATVFNEAVIAGLNTTTATAIVSATPSAITTNWEADIKGTVEHAASAHTLNIMTSTATAADTVTVLRGSYCALTP